ncbi:C39 family peptidase [Patescibacteria group bacterium]|nr:C39 family peptidase [Patescibacteria group bacterium]MBU2259038.1 C39 family peptidase [Patescibacteria group bacterium]
MRLPIYIIIGLLLTACTAQVTPDEEHPLPKRVSISVPFSPQAPFANWDAPYQEACEEMSLIMAHYFLEGKELTPQIADNEILDLIAWEKAHGYPEDVTLTQLALIGCEYYKDCTNYVINKVTVEAIKEQLAQGHPIIVPAAGRTLLNPYFSGEGPWYHMLVITGYDSGRFITNDPGTKRGEGYKYAHDILLNAVHDWTGAKEDIFRGEKRMLVVRSPQGQHDQGKENDSGYID